MEGQVLLEQRYCQLHGPTCHSAKTSLPFTTRGKAEQEWSDEKEISRLQLWAQTTSGLTNEAPDNHFGKTFKEPFYSVSTKRVPNLLPCCPPHAPSNRASFCPLLSPAGPGNTWLQSANYRNPERNTNKEEHPDGIAEPQETPGEPPPAQQKSPQWEEIFTFRFPLHLLPPSTHMRWQCYLLTLTWLSFTADYSWSFCTVWSPTTRKKGASGSRKSEVLLPKTALQLSPPDINCIISSFISCKLPPTFENTSAPQ